MNRTTLSMVLVLGVLGVGAGVAALSRHSAAPAMTVAPPAANDTGSDAAAPETAVAAKAAIDLTGEWHLDRDRSDQPRGVGRRGGGMRRYRLPETLRIVQADSRLQISDSAGAVVQEIVIGGTQAPTEGAPRLSARWNGAHLEIQRPGRQGMTFRESWGLEDGGRTLVIRTRVGRDDGSAPARELKRVYRRVAES